jgi:hypothetical protein
MISSSTTNASAYHSAAPWIGTCSGSGRWPSSRSSSARRSSRSSASARSASRVRTTTRPGPSSGLARRRPRRPREERRVTRRPQRPVTHEPGRVTKHCLRVLDRGNRLHDLRPGRADSKHLQHRAPQPPGRRASRSAFTGSGFPGRRSGVRAAAAARHRCDRRPSPIRGRASCRGQCRELCAPRFGRRAPFGGARAP